MMLSTTASQLIIAEVAAWPGVAAGEGRRGEFAFWLGHREFGHLHGDEVAHFDFPRQMWHSLIREGRIAPHPMFPDLAGPGARSIRSEEDILDVIELLRLNYERLVARHGLPAPA